MKSPGNIGNDENSLASPTCNSHLSKGGLKGGNAAVKKFERAEVLSELGLSRDALSELIFISKTTTSIEDILYIGSKLQDMREYKYLISLADKLPKIETGVTCAIPARTGILLNRHPNRTVLILFLYSPL